MNEMVYMVLAFVIPFGILGLVSHFQHFFRIHDWKRIGQVEVVEDKCGPYDPRSDVDRTSTFHEFICCTCGKKRRSYRRYL